MRINQRFVKELRKEQLGCDRVLHIIDALDVVPVQAFYQRQVVDKTLTDIINCKAQRKEAKRQEEESAKKKLEEREKNCTECWLAGSGSD